MTATVPTFHEVHPRFKLNGFHMDKEDMLRLAYSFIKEGDEYERPVGMFLLDWFDDSETIEINTSGTTGKAKTIMMKKEAMVNSAIASGDFFDLMPGDKALLCLPVKYIAGKMMLVRAFVLGLDLDFITPGANPFLKNNTIYDFAAMVPLQAHNSLKQIGKQVKKLIVGGVRVGQNLSRQLAKLPTEVYETYGMTETVTHIAARKIGEKAFTVMPGVTLSYDANNCLVIHAPRVSSEVIATNDLVEPVNENQFIFLGRIDNIVNSGGIKLIPEQIEEKLSGKISGRYFVGGAPDEKLDEKLVLIVEGDKREIEDNVFEDLDKYEKPKRIYFVPKFSETDTGKVMRKQTIAEALKLLS